MVQLSGDYSIAFAANFEKFEAVQKLIEYGADSDAKNRFGWTPVYWVKRSSIQGWFCP
jgi:ankyrin repeat protein